MPATDASSSTINTKFTDTTNGVGVSPVDKDQGFTDNDTLSNVSGFTMVQIGTFKTRLLTVIFLFQVQSHRIRLT